MAKVEYRCERIQTIDAGEIVAQLNRLGETGWQVFHLDPAAGAYQAWLSREVPVTAAGLGPASTRPVAGRATAPAPAAP